MTIQCSLFQLNCLNYLHFISSIVHCDEMSSIVCLFMLFQQIINHKNQAIQRRGVEANGAMALQPVKAPSVLPLPVKYVCFVISFYILQMLVPGLMVAMQFTAAASMTQRDSIASGMLTIELVMDIQIVKALRMRLC